jgi:dihydroxyacetone kinase-like predicted kinase
MKFVLKDGFIHIVNSTGLVNNKLEAEVVTKYVDDYKRKVFRYRINDGDYIVLENNTILFHDTDYQDGSIKLVIKATDSNGTKEFFMSDIIPVTFAVVFGKRIEDAYPEVIQHILERLDRMDVVLTNVIDAMAEVDKKGNLL